MNCSTNSALKNRIAKNEQMLRELANMKSMAQKSNFLSMNMAKQIDARREIIQETLEIDRAALKEKQEAKRSEEKTKKQKKGENRWAVSYSIQRNKIKILLR